MCWAYVGIVQIALDTPPPLYQTGTGNMAFNENRIWHCAFLSHDLNFRVNKFTQTNKHNLNINWDMKLANDPFSNYILKYLPSRTNKINSTWIPQILFFAVALRDFPPVWEHSEKITKTYRELIWNWYWLGVHTLERRAAWAVQLNCLEEVGNYAQIIIIIFGIRILFDYDKVSASGATSIPRCNKKSDG